MKAVSSPVQCEHVVLRESRAEDEGDERKAVFTYE